jgi:8-oxo-dGTP diphosphatase
MLSKPYALSVKVVILNQSGECLLLKRSFDSANNPGKWEFPGGKVEGSEKFDEALLREVYEETGLTISLMRVAGSAEYELPAMRIAYIIMEGCPASGEVKLSKEHLEFTWTPPGEIQSLDLAEQFIPFVKKFFKLDL